MVYNCKIKSEAEMDYNNFKQNGEYIDPASGDSISLNTMYTDEIKELVDKINTTQNYININKFNECALEFVNSVFGDLQTFKNICPGWRVMGADAGGVLIPRLISPKGVIYYGNDAIRKGIELREKRMPLIKEQSEIQDYVPPTEENTEQNGENQ